MSATSQQIAFDPSAFVGFSDEQLALIRQGFESALGEVYERETEARGERLGHVELHDPEENRLDWDEICDSRAAGRDHMYECGRDEFEAGTEPRFRDDRDYMDGWSESADIEAMLP